MSNSSESVPNQLHEPFVSLLLSVADEKFFLGHRNSDWTGLGPFLEEDIAFSNIAQDEIAHAQELYKLAAAFTARAAGVCRRSADPTRHRLGPPVERQRQAHRPADRRPPTDVCFQMREHLCEDDAAMCGSVY